MGSNEGRERLGRRPGAGRAPWSPAAPAQSRVHARRRSFPGPGDRGQHRDLPAPRRGPSSQPAHRTAPRAGGGTDRRRQRRDGHQCRALRPVDPSALGRDREAPAGLLRRLRLGGERGARRGGERASAREGTVGQRRLLPRSRRPGRARPADPSGRRRGLSVDAGDRQPRLLAKPAGRSRSGRRWPARGGRRADGDHRGRATRVLRPGRGRGLRRCDRVLQTEGGAAAGSLRRLRDGTPAPRLDGRESVRPFRSDRPGPPRRNRDHRLQHEQGGALPELPPGRVPGLGRGQCPAEPVRRLAMAPARGHGPRAADRLREPRQPHACPGRRPRARDRGARGPRGLARAALPAAPRGKRAPRGSGRGHRRSPRRAAP